MRAAVAFVITASLLAGACFPNNPKHRMYAQLGEGAALAGGITMLYFVNSGADCDMNSAPGGEPDDGCKTKATVLGDIGLGLILIGLVGFIATVSTAEDAKPTPTVVVPKADVPVTVPAPAPAPAPASTIAIPPAEPAPAPAGDGAGSATP
jgi:hypothetical protein